MRPVTTLLASLFAASALCAAGLPQNPPPSNAQLNGDPTFHPEGADREGARDLCDAAYELACNTTVFGGSELSQNGDAWGYYWFSWETGPEVIYRLDHPGGLLSLSLNSGDSNQLDLILLNGCDQSYTLAMPWLVGSYETISGNYPAGVYYVVVDAYSWNGLPYSFQLDATCAAPVDFCANALPLPCGSLVNGSSAQSQNGNLWSTYCFGGDTGPEVIFELVHPGGALNLSLNSVDSNQLDLVLLGGCDGAQCLAMPWWIGSQETISGDYAPGTYYVVVDAFSWNGLPFTFSLEATCPGATDPCAGALPLATGQTVTGSSAQSQNGNLWGSYCFSGESAPEVIYELSHPGGELNLTLSSADSDQLDLILLGDCDPASCMAMPWWVGSDETISGDYPAGTYYVVVDAFFWNGAPFTFQLATSGPQLVGAEEQPLRLALGQNTPNPFNPVTYISYSLPETGMVSLQVFDLAGHQVAALVDGIQERGEHGLAFDGSGLASGVYFYALQSAGVVETRKMVLIK